MTLRVTERPISDVRFNVRLSLKRKKYRAAQTDAMGHNGSTPPRIGLSRSRLRCPYSPQRNQNAKAHLLDILAPARYSVMGAVLVSPTTLGQWQLAQTMTVAIACTTGLYASLFRRLSRREATRGEGGLLRRGGRSAEAVAKAAVAKTKHHVRMIIRPPFWWRASGRL